MSFIGFCITKDRTVLALLLFIVLFGTGSYINISKESYPDVALPMALISADFFGASPEENDTLLIRPIVLEINSVPGIKQINTYAMDDIGYITVEFDDTIPLAPAIQEVRDKINNVRTTLPEGVRNLGVEEVNVSMFPVLTVILRSDMPYRQLREIALNLQDEIEAGIPGVLEAEVVGDRDEIVDIVVSPEILEGYKITLPQIMAMVRRANSFNGIGEIRQEHGQYAITVSTILTDLQDIMEIPVKSIKGGVLYLKDVAQIRHTYRDPTTAARVDGKDAIALEISKKTGVDVMKVTNGTKKLVDDMKKYWPENIEVVYSQDSSVSVKDSVRNLENSVIFAIIIVFWIIKVFSNSNLAFLVSLTIPGSFFFGIIAINMMGYTINIMVLFGLMLSIGILVDAALVVVEYADRLINLKYEYTRAFREAAEKMTVSITASTLTTIVVFLPLLFWPGTTGQFVKYLPITVLFVMTGSLAMALIFIPTIGSMWYKLFPSHDDTYLKKIKAIEEYEVDQFDYITSQYHRAIKHVLSNPKRFLRRTLIFSAIIIITFVLLGQGVEFFPDIEPDNAVVMVKSRGNLSFDEKVRVIREAENKIIDMKDDIRVLYSRIGSSQSDGSIEKDIIGKMFLELRPWDERRKADPLLHEVVTRLEEIPGVNFETIKQSIGPPKLSDIELLLTSRAGMDVLRKSAEKVKSLMRQMNTFTYIKDSLSTGLIKFNMEIDDQKASLLRIDKSTIAEAISMYAGGLNLGKYYGGKRDEMDIMLHLDRDYRDIASMLTLKVNNIDGVFVSLSDFTTLQGKQAGNVERVGTARAIRIHANVKQGLVVNNQLLALRDLMLEDWDPMVDFKFEGQAEDLEDSRAFLIKAFIIALCGVILILLLTFNSLTHTILVITAIFFSITGVLLGILITHSPFGVVMCGMAIITLAGISVNNNILLVDMYNIYLRSGLNAEQSLIHATVSRLRPILLTSGTTSLGLLPMVLKVNVDFFELKITYDAPSSQFWNQLSSAIAGGVLFATIIALFFTPAALAWIATWQKVDNVPSEDDKNNKAGDKPVLSET